MSASGQRPLSFPTKVLLRPELFALRAQADRDVRAP
jgi:hypothetical protein